MLTSDAVVIHVPFQSTNNFEVHKIESFPFTVNRIIITLDLPPSIILISKDVSLYSINLVSDLLKCKTEYLHLYHCPANIFAFLSISNAEVGEVELTEIDASKALALC